MNPQGPDLLSQLRDIHGAPAVPWWPPAPGWWVLAVLVAVGLYFAFRYANRHYRARQRRAILGRFVDGVEQHIDPRQSPQEFLSSLNRIFKIVALHAFPESHCALMQGSEWVEFVEMKIGEAGAGEDLSVLAEGPYQQAPQFDPKSLTKLARQWIRQHG